MEVLCKRFEELSNEELYEILKLRVDVFVVEQECPYPELDDLDQEALHVYLKENDEICAYLRILQPGVKDKDAALGRIVTKHRKKGYGRMVVEKGIEVVKGMDHAQGIYIEAQEYAQGFYEKLGFVRCSDVFLEDGIPHIQMRYQI